MAAAEFWPDRWSQLDLPHLDWPPGCLSGAEPALAVADSDLGGYPDVLAAAPPSADACLVEHHCSLGAGAAVGALPALARGGLPMVSEHAKPAQHDSLRTDRRRRVPVVATGSVDR